MVKVILVHDRTAVMKKKKERQNLNLYTLRNKVGSSHWHSQLFMFCRKKKSEKQKCAVPSLLPFMVSSHVVLSSQPHTATLSACEVSHSRDL